MKTPEERRTFLFGPHRRLREMLQAIERRHLNLFENPSEKEMRRIDENLLRDVRLIYNEYCGDEKQTPE